jgi:hypothetical protein
MLPFLVSITATAYPVLSEAFNLHRLTVFNLHFNSAFMDAERAYRGNPATHENPPSAILNLKSHPSLFKV